MEVRPMASVDLEAIGGFVDVPTMARRLLAEPEKQVILNLSVRIDEGEVLTAPTYVVYYNTARGPAKGGIRLAPNVTLAETVDLAERMVWKTALVGIPFGGGKSGIAVDPRSVTRFVRDGIIREYVHIIEEELLTGAYIPAPDLGSTPHDMAVIYGQTHVLTSVTGKPPRVGGLPGRLEATGRGVAYTARLALERLMGRPLEGTHVAVQGFGNVGGWTATFLEKWGARIVAATDVNGGLHNERGLEAAGLYEAARRGEDPLGEGPGDRITNAEILGLDVDILVPAAVENVLSDETAGLVKAPLVVEGANGPTTPEGDRVLKDAGVVVVPDILANAGGVTASYVEWRNAKSGSITNREEVFGTLETILTLAFDKVVETADREGTSLRAAAQIIAVGEVVESMRDRGWI
jgi:glutamate dehydrogenase/leucine dehydrogenase